MEAVYKLEKSRIVDELSGCWNWTKQRNSKGYGRVKHNGRMWLVHRLAYTVLVGEIPDGLFVLHRCDNRACFNPSHLFLGTQADNIADMVSKGREPRHETHGRSKLTSENVRHLRSEVANGVPQVVFSKQFDISHGHVSEIVNYRKWRA